MQEHGLIPLVMWVCNGLVMWGCSGLQYRWILRSCDSAS